jgi:hypothetical protein
MAMFLPMGLKAGKILASGACGKALEMISKSMKEKISMAGDKVCSPEFPEVLKTQLLTQMKESKFFPGLVRKKLEENPKILLDFINSVKNQPEFSSACSTKDYIKIFSIIDSKLSEFRKKIPGCGDGNISTNTPIVNSPVEPVTNTSVTNTSVAPVTNTPITGGYRKKNKRTINKRRKAKKSRKTKSKSRKI